MNLSESVKKRDISGYVTEKIAILEGELKNTYTKEHSEKVYGQIFELLEADKRLLKDDEKNYIKINDFYEKLSSHIANKKERERKELESSPTKQPKNRRNVDNDSSNDFSP